MALSAVSGVLTKLGDLTLQKAFELYGVADQVEHMRLELSLIQGVLQDADSIPNHNQSQARKNWMRELGDVANRIDNVMDSYLVNIKKEETDRWSRKLKFWKKPLHLNDLSAEIVKITRILKTLFERGSQLGLAPSAAGTQMGTASASASASATVTEDTAFLPSRPTKPSDIDDSQVVGLDSDKDHIIHDLLDVKNSKRTVRSIVGVGGLGKTTLAQQVYNSLKYEERFHCRAWVFISQRFNKINVLREILYSINPKLKEEIKERKTPPPLDEDLETAVRNYLSKKRYLIILDDVWTEDVWEQLEKTILDKKNGSRVIITTRNLNVAKAADGTTEPHKLRFLTDVESITLLLKKACLPHENYPRMEVVAQRLIKKCGGLPLALVVLGGILSTEEEHNFDTWNRVYQNMSWHDEDGEKCMKILAMSYDHLRNRDQKQCFLYFAAFPEDYNISADHMFRMWVADGLIQNDETAEKYMKELVKRNLVQVTEKYANGNCKHCRMHDLLRNLAIHKAEEDNFFAILSKEGSGGNKQLAPKRVAVQFCSLTNWNINPTNTRSLLCFGKDISNYKPFGQLRVLVFEKVDKMSMAPYKNWLEGLVYLKYLGFRYCTDVPELDNISFSGLKSLETLNCKGTKIRVNSSLWKIPTLRRVITGWDSVVQCPLNWDHLENLQRLDWVHLNKTFTLECDLNLRTLKIVHDDKDPVDSLIELVFKIRALLSRTHHLVSLAISSSMAPLPYLDTRGLPCHEKIQSLILRGRLPSPEFITLFPKYLTKLVLIFSMLEEDPMPVLKDLQSLRILNISFFAYIGKKMICSSGGFFCLEKLKLGELAVDEWEIEAGAMPALSHLEITNSLSLHAIPQLQNVPSLQELSVSAVSEELVKWLQTDGRSEIAHIPSIRITRD